MGKIKNWVKVRDRPSEIVWVNKNAYLRVVAAKGNQSWQVWYEKNVGKVASDNAFISNAVIGALLDKNGAIESASNWMRSHS